jgi:hypothetical protein
LLLSKWTAVPPLNREKHFVVVRMIEPEPPAVRSLKRHAVRDADSLSRVNETAWQGRTGLETAKARFAKDESAVIEAAFSTLGFGRRLAFAGADQCVRAAVRRRICRR